MNIRTYVLHIDEIEKDIFKNNVIKNNINDDNFNYFIGVDGKKFIKNYLDYLSDFDRDEFRIDNINSPEIIEYILWYKNQYGKALISSCGAWGHILSFINILKDAIICNYDRIIIYEFDAIFMNNFNKHLDRFKETIYSSLYPVLYLGASQLNWTDITVKDHLYQANRYTNGTFALALDKSVFKEYLYLLELKILPSDTCLFFLNYPKYVIYPNLVIADITVSKIRQKQNLKKVSKILKWNLQLYQVAN
jgi:hypothetical protein